MLEVRNIFRVWGWLFTPNSGLLSDYCEARERARRLHIIVHRVKTEWILSGTVRNENGVIQDAGYLRSPTKMNRAQALKYFARAFPRGNILHVDDKNKIITYSY